MAGHKDAFSRFSLTAGSPILPPPNTFPANLSLPQDSCYMATPNAYAFPFDNTTSITPLPALGSPDTYSSATVSCSRIAANATLALNAGLCLVRFPFIFFSSLPA